MILFFKKEGEGTLNRDDGSSRMKAPLPFTTKMGRKVVQVRRQQTPIVVSFFPGGRRPSNCPRKEEGTPCRVVECGKRQKGSALPTSGKKRQAVLGRGEKSTSTTAPQMGERGKAKVKPFSVCSEKENKKSVASLLLFPDRRRKIACKKEDMCPLGFEGSLEGVSEEKQHPC